MTERARIQEEYKSKKRMPAPEVIKPRPHHDEKKRFIIEERWIPDPKVKDTPWFMRSMSAKERLDWNKYGKYRTRADAEKALATLNRHAKHHAYLGTYEFRLREIE